MQSIQLGVPGPLRVCEQMGSWCITYSVVFINIKIVKYNVCECLDEIVDRFTILPSLVYCRWLSVVAYDKLWKEQIFSLNYYEVIKAVWIIINTIYSVQYRMQNNTNI